MKRAFGLASIMAVAMASASAAAGKIFGAENIERYIQQHGRTRDHRSKGRTSIAQRNRWDGLPHLHEREIARRRRQQARQAA
jgi:uncharacterized protein YaiI (UPF0178 family)